MGREFLQYGMDGEDPERFGNPCTLLVVFKLAPQALFLLQDDFVQRMVGHIMTLLSPSQFDELSPLEVVLVFQQFTILQCLMEYSSDVIKFTRRHFYEEFK
jgi:hypothetical protein